MPRYWLALSLFLFLPACTTQAQYLSEDFDAAPLDWTAWCPCQIDTEDAPLQFLSDPQGGADFVRITADEASLGGNVCRSGEPEYECLPPQSSPAFALLSSMEVADSEPDFAETLGPSLIGEDIEMQTLSAKPDPYCSEEVWRRARAAGEEDRCIQRQELRFQKPLRHDSRAPAVYGLRFRMPETIENRTDSIRWVTAQWKQAPIARRYCRQFDCGSWGPSPFLAQRFDDGILHVTVQDEHCRCKIASAPDPNDLDRQWRDGPVRDCRSTHPATEGDLCVARLEAVYGDDPVLSSARGDWSELEYLVQTGWNGDGVVELREAGRLIVRVTGRIGYEQRWFDASQTKFKIGIYRNYMPYIHAMDIDRVTVRPVRN